MSRLQPTPAAALRSTSHGSHGSKRPHMLPLAAILLLVLGLAALLLGLRGRLLDDHPICRLCRFDLIGTYPTPLCPECGAGLQATRGRTPVLLGHRKRRWWAIVPGVALLLLSGAGAWLALSGLASRVDWMTYKPTWLVAREASSPTPSRAAPALRELMDRISANQVSTAQLARLADRALDSQSATSQIWFGAGPATPAWSNVFESAWTAGALSQSQLLRFAHQAIVARPSFPTTVPRGHAWAIGPEFVERRVVPTRRLGYHVQLIRLAIDGKIILDRAPDPGRTAAGGGGLGRGDPWIPTSDSFTVDAPEGERSVEAVYQLWIFDGWGTAPLIDSWPVTFRGTLTVLPAGTQTIRPVVTEPLRQAVAGAIKVRSPIRNIIDASGQYTWGAIDIDNPPVNVAFDIVLRADGREWPLGSVAARAGDRTTSGLGGREWPLTGLASATADIILRPSPAAAERHLTVAAPEIWGEEIVLPGLAIQEVRQNK